MSRWVCLSCLLLPLIGLAQPQGLDTLWTRMFGGQDNDYGYDVQSLPDGSVLVGGSGALTPPWAEHTAILAKLDSNGAMLWCREYRETNLREVDAFKITSDGGLIVGGRTTELDFAVMKMDSSGSVQWEAVSPFYGALFLSVCVLEPREGGYFAVQSGGSFNGPDIHVLRYDDNGDTLWTRHFGGIGGDMVTGAIQTEDGGFILSGSIDVPYPDGLTFDAYLLKLDSHGNEQWSHVYSAPDDEWINGLAKVDSGYLMVGYVQDWNSIQDYVYIQKVGLTGDSLWARRYSELGQAHCADALRLPNGNVVLCGSRNSTTMLIEMNPDGQILWSRDYIPGSRRYGLRMALSGATDLTAAGYGWSSDSGYEMNVIQWSYPSVQVVQEYSHTPSFDLIQNYPNPFNATTTISYSLSKPRPATLQVFDVTGRHVETLVDGLQQPGEHSVSFDGSNLSSGIYFVRMESGAVSQTRKMVLLK